MIVQVRPSDTAKIVKAASASVLQQLLSGSKDHNGEGAVVVAPAPAPAPAAAAPAADKCSSPENNKSYDTALSHVAVKPEVLNLELGISEYLMEALWGCHGSGSLEVQRKCLELGCSFDCRVQVIRALGFYCKASGSGFSCTNGFSLASQIE